MAVMSEMVVRYSQHCHSGVPIFWSLGGVATLEPGGYPLIRMT